jgi:hypothetical protein
MVENMKGKTVGNWKLMQKCLYLDLKVSRKMVLMVLCSHYPNIFPGEARIAKEASIGLTAVKGALDYLEREGWITRQRRYSKTTVYTVNVERIMAAPPLKFGIPAVEGGLPFPGPEAEPVPQLPESVGIRPSEPPPETAGIRLSEPSQTAGIRPINSRNPATNRQDNIQVLTDKKDESEKTSEQEQINTACEQEDNIIADEDIESTNHASKELENKTQEPNAGIEEATVTNKPAPTPTSVSTPSPISMPEKKDKASSASAPSVSKPPAVALPANWKVLREPTGRWVVYEVSADRKSSMPIGFGRTREAAIADARALLKRAASIQAKWDKADS